MTTYRHRLSYLMTTSWWVMMVQMYLLLLQRSLADVELSVSPTNIKVGLSPSLDVNCTFSINTSSAMTEIVSLIVSRGNNTELASITTFSDQQVNVISSEGITADGVINPGGQSYILLHWDYPTDTQNGTYECVARGLDDSGQNVEVVNTSVVSADLPDVQALVDEVKQMQNYINQLEDRMTSLKAENEYRFPSVFSLPPLHYKNKLYYLSDVGFMNYDESIFICRAYGGILAEMDDLDEYHAVQAYLTDVHTFMISLAYIGGTDFDHDNTWVLPSSNQPMPVVDWSPGFDPSQGHEFDCICLSSSDDWSMSVFFCDNEARVPNWRYLCEIPE